MAKKPKSGQASLLSFGNSAVVNGDTRVARQPVASPARPMPRYFRPALAGLLLLAATAGAGAAGTGVGAGGPWRGHPVAIGTALELALALL